MAPATTSSPPANGASSGVTLPLAAPGSDVASNLANMSQAQLMELLKNLPNVFTAHKSVPGNKEDAAQALQTLSSTSTFSVGGVNDPGPSSHPHGPPNLGQAADPGPPPEQSPVPAPLSPSASAPAVGAPTSSGGGRRSRGGAAMGTDEWTRQRKDNHKEVERRRRGNINEGINELGRIVPNGSGEKAKGAILSRAVQYIHHLKENEARNIEKWTLEKLLMDQAMGDMQAQLEEVRRMWDNEREARQKAEQELAAVKAGGAKSKKRAAGEDEEDAEAKRQKTE